MHLVFKLSSAAAAEIRSTANRLDHVFRDPSGTGPFLTSPRLQGRTQARKVLQQRYWGYSITAGYLLERLTSMASPNLIPHMHLILENLTASPYPELPSPENVPRRASVAFILRVNPSYSHWPPSEPSSSSAPPQDLHSFLSQSWVTHGSPELLFIKRASRPGDRWTSHVALPGGKRDPTDADDAAAAVRETWEEVGLDLTKHAIACGNLPQRLVTTHWGKKHLMVLCPYVYILNSHDVPPLRLQPTEVASTHWVPLSRLSAPEQRTLAYEDVSSRLANQETGVRKWMLQLVLGRMMFAAISLVPSESIHSPETPIPAIAKSRTVSSTQTFNAVAAIAISTGSSLPLLSLLLLPASTPPPTSPLLLWGLTLGVVSDFLDLLPPHDALELWSYPTFSPPDVRFWVWLLTYRFKERKRVELQAGTLENGLGRPSFGGASESLASASLAALDAQEDSVVSESTVLVERPHETGMHGLGTGIGGQQRKKQAAVATMLEGWAEPIAETVLPMIANRGRYYDIVRKAVAVALVGRVGMGVVVGIVLYRSWRDGGRGWRSGLRLGRGW